MRPYFYREEQLHIVELMESRRQLFESWDSWLQSDVAQGDSRDTLLGGDEEAG